MQASLAPGPETSSSHTRHGPGASVPTLRCLAVVAFITGCTGSMGALADRDGQQERTDAHVVGDDASTLFDAQLDGSRPRDGGAIATSADASERLEDAASRSFDASFGDPGCGLQQAAFCDTFDGPASEDRAGELDQRLWSASRMQPGLSGNKSEAVYIESATLRPLRSGQRLPACRGDLPNSVLPPMDTLVCDASSMIQSPHLLVAAAAQNYGQNSYRIRQPFDFAGRIGEVRFDTELEPGGLLGWVSLVISEDPSPAPGFADRNNFEGSPVPRNALSLQFLYSNCAGINRARVFSNHKQSNVDNTEASCVDWKWGQLNRVSVKVSESLVEVFASAPSEDGVTFGPLKKIGSFAVTLPFTRGYVSITVHNHATKKYSDGGQGFSNLDAWVARWDNVGFDGPIIPPAREYDAPNAGASVGSGVSVGWRVPDASDGKTTAIKVAGVDVAGASSARVALNVGYCPHCGESSQYNLKLRVNSGAWLDRKLSAAEIAAISSGSGTIGLLIEVPLADLQAGSNTFEFVSEGHHTGYPMAVSNITLLVR